MSVSVVKSTSYSGREPDFSSENPCGSSQPSVLQFQGLQNHLLASMGTRHMHGAQIYASKTLMHTK